MDSVLFMEQRVGSTGSQASPKVGCRDGTVRGIRIGICQRLRASALTSSGALLEWRLSCCWLPLLDIGLRASPLPSSLLEP